MASTDKRGFQLEQVKIKLTDFCNLRCQKCNHWKPGRESRRDRVDSLSTEEWVDFAHQSIACGVKKVRFSGGEPTLSKNLLVLCGLFHKAGVSLSMTTNGTLIGPNLAEKLIQSGIKHFTFSVDGPNATVHDELVGVAGSFEKIESAISYIHASSEDTAISINCVLNSDNVPYMKEMIDWAAKNNVADVSFLELQVEHLNLNYEIPDCISSVTFCNLVEYGKEKEIMVSHTRYVRDQQNDLIALTDTFWREAPCSIVWNGITIFPSGDIFVCCHGKNKLLRYGNIHKKSLRKMLYDNHAQTIRDICCKPYATIPECLDCDIHLAERYYNWASSG